MQDPRLTYKQGNPSENVAHDISREEARRVEEQERQDRMAQSDELAKKAHQQAKAFAGENTGYACFFSFFINQISSWS